MDYLQYSKSNQHYLEIECSPKITDISKFVSPDKPQTDFSDQPLYLLVSQCPVVLFLVNTVQKYWKEHLQLKRCVSRYQNPDADGFDLEHAVPIEQV